MSDLRTIGDVGEKGIIEEYLRPLFNPDNDANGVGEDCAAIEFPAGSTALLSTDRVPADLISFEAGFLDYFGLGRYLAVLNLSDIASCGGQASALLLNFGLPAALPLSSLMEMCSGVMSVASSTGIRVMGGDLSLSSELSISATAIGFVETGKLLRRSGAQPGDVVFTSRPIGLTPCALRYCLRPEAFSGYDRNEIELLLSQFRSLEPMLALGRRLSISGVCTAAMDNTDGVWQSLFELSRESKVGMVVDSSKLDIPPIVQKYTKMAGYEPVTFAMGGGADFSLIGTLRGDWTPEALVAAFRSDVKIVGRCVEGTGISLETDGVQQPLTVPGWNYFVP